MLLNEPRSGGKAAPPAGMLWEAPAGASDASSASESPALLMLASAAPVPCASMCLKRTCKLFTTSPLYFSSTTRMSSFGSGMECSGRARSCDPSGLTWYPI